MSAKDHFRTQNRSRAGGPSHLINVTPDDNADLPFVTQWLYLANQGELTITTSGGETLTTPVLQAGWHPIEVSRVYASGTTATGIMAGW